MDFRRALHQAAGIASLLFFLVACGASQATPTAAPTSLAPEVTASDERRIDGLSQEEVATLRSLEQVDSYPLYTMRYYANYEQADTPAGSATSPRFLAEIPEGLPDAGASLSTPRWACSLFAALGEADHALFGRNFDWEYSPAMLLFTDPPDGYASVSMVDIAYLGFRGSRAGGVTELPLAERRGLLQAPFLPFDGMNERGLAVGMAAVPGSEMAYDPDKETLSSLMVIREMLDHARDVDEALDLLHKYNIDWSGGPPLHYLIADALGHAALVEFYQGEMLVFPNDVPWHLATNFLRSTAGETVRAKCWRYDHIFLHLQDTEGKITPQEAVDLLAGVSQEGTQWSIVYELSAGGIHVAMAKEFENVHTFRLNSPSQ